MTDEQWYNAEILPELEALAARAASHGVPMLVIGEVECDGSDCPRHAETSTPHVTRIIVRVGGSIMSKDLSRICAWLGVPNVLSKRERRFQLPQFGEN
jgi:Ser/Thr protein kinase RdoA (MazF antagonist)